jgi:hypothetical protein
MGDLLLLERQVLYPVSIVLHGAIPIFFSILSLQRQHTFRLNLPTVSRSTFETFYVPKFPTIKGKSTPSSHRVMS